jgi:NitT/TauT family transport system ATP-binding protein
MIAGFEAPTAGEIRVAGARVAGEIPKGLGYIFQKDTVLPWYTVRHNIALGLRYRGRPKREIADKVARPGHAGGARRVRGRVSARAFGRPCAAASPW